jgi:hypothetical protein
MDYITGWIANNNDNSPLILSCLYLTELPPIPQNCKKLICHNNFLTSLPDLPNCEELDCSDNKLINLPELPKCKILHCQYNNLQILPELPNCQKLICDGNRLTFLPQLPKCIMLSSMEGNGNRYLYRTEELAQRARSFESHNYNKFARIIQRKYRKYTKEKYSRLLTNYLLKGPISVVCLYVI